MLEIKKQEYIDELNHRVKDKILNKANAEFLAKLINKADSLEEVQAIMAMGTTYKRTGFHFDFRKEPACSNIKYLKKNEKLSFVTDKDALTHKLIIGDNYDALRQLLITHRGLIDVIYIDPPYGKDSMGRFADTNYTNAITRDNLLSMLYTRLQLARDLLSDKGIIYCSIDDRNQAYIKCLFDEVFSENNFISCMTCHSNPGGNKSDFVENTLSYVFVYAKNRNSMMDLGHFEELDKFSFRFKDEYGFYKKGGQLEKWGNDDTTHTHPNLAYSIYYNPTTQDAKCIFDYNQEEINEDRTKNIVYETPDVALLSQGYYCIRPRRTNTGDGGRWRMEPATFFERLAKNAFIFEQQGDGYKIYEKERFKAEKFKKAKNFIPSEIAKQNSAELIDIFGNKPFDYPKPVSLLKHLISLYQNNDCIVLDFFAGSGTTAEAVLSLNKYDNGNRRFILCTNNEITTTNPSGIAYDVTAKRLKRIMTGECYDSTKNFKWLDNNEPYGNNLEVTEISEISPTVSEKDNTPFDVIDESLYGILPFDKKEDKINWICTYFKNTMKGIESDKKYCERWGE